MNIQEVKLKADGQWAEIAQRIGIDSSFLDGSPGPCPKCGGRDRFRVFPDFEQTGGAVCNQCGKFGDGISLVRWFCDLKLKEAIEKIGSEVGIEPAPKKRSPTLAEKDPNKHFEKLDWNETVASFWTKKKTPISVEALKLFGAVRGRYRKSYPVIGLPVIGENGLPGGWCFYHATGKELPFWTPGSSEPQWAKIKIAAGTKPGWIGSPAREGEKVVFKLEGPSDALALASLPLADDCGVVTNPFGAGEDPLKNPWMLERFRGKVVYVIHDCDGPGQDGALEVKNGNKTRPGWAKTIATVAKEVRNVVLPYPIEQTHGKDLRDWIREQIEAGLIPETIVGELLQMCETSILISSPGDLSAIQEEAISLDIEKEHIDDPHRLARLNLEKYESLHNRSLVYWRETWYSWQDGVYSQIGTDHLVSRINFSIKEEFDRAWEDEKKKYLDWRKSSKYDPENDKGPPKVRKVTTSLVNNVYSATKGICTLRSGQEMHTWTRSKDSPEGLCIAVRNGILNLTKAISEGATKEEVLIKHSRNWFSTTKLSFNFDENAQCPEWIKFLNSSFPDQVSIDVLQKWFGYLLVPDNRLQKMLFVIGRPRSGKGTIIQVMKDLFGDSAVATPTLAELAKDFSLESLTEKTVAIIADARLSDRVDQTVITERLLSISGGDPQNIQRKYKETLSAATLNARFTLFSNLVPKLADLSMAFLSRCVFLHMPKSFLGKEDYSLSDKLHRELPGILNWSIVGRHKLNQDLRLVQPVSGEKLVIEMKSLMSPVFLFMENCCQSKEDAWVDTKEIYQAWERWCEENDHHAGSPSSFSRKLKAIDSCLDVEQYRDSQGKRRRFIGIRLVDSEVY